MKIIGHRGASGYAPENTLESFEKAIELGVDYIELDVQFSKDGEMYVMHDKRVDRTTNGTGRISDLESAHIEEITTEDGHKIPRLDDVIDLVDRRCGLMIEIISPNMSEAIISSLREYSMEERSIIASFRHSELVDAFNISPEIHRLALIEAIPVDPVSFATDAHATHVGLAIDSIDCQFVNTLKNEDIIVFSYTVNDIRDMNWLSDCKIDGIITDYPDLAKDQLM